MLAQQRGPVHHVASTTPRRPRQQLRRSLPPALGHQRHSPRARRPARQVAHSPRSSSAACWRSSRMGPNRRPSPCRQPARQAPRTRRPHSRPRPRLRPAAALGGAPAHKPAPSRCGVWAACCRPRPPWRPQLCAGCCATAPRSSRAQQPPPGRRPGRRPEEPCARGRRRQCSLQRTPGATAARARPLPPQPLLLLRRPHLLPARRDPSVARQSRGESWPWGARTHAPLPRRLRTQRPPPRGDQRR